MKANEDSNFESAPAPQETSESFAASPRLSLEEDFRRALRKLTSSVCIAATDGPAGRAGLTVTSFLSVSLDPPSALICLNASSGVLPILLKNRVFGVSMLHAQQRRMAEIFSQSQTDYEHRFASGEWTTLTTGAPLLSGAIAQFDCRLAQTMDFGSHRIIIGEIAELKHIEDSAVKSLFYSQRGYHAFP